MSRYNLRNDELNSIKAIDGFDGEFTTFIYNDLNDKYGNMFTITIKDRVLSIYPFNINEDYAGQFDIKRILFDDIQYYVLDGEKYHEQIISGGGSGDINIGGAIIGGMIAGGAGMVLGGQRKVNEVTSTTVEHDTRKIKMIYLKNGISSVIYFEIDIYDFLLDKMPEKDYEVVVTNKRSKHINFSVSDLDKMKELKLMLDDGLITQEEYEQRKNKILDNM